MGLYSGSGVLPSGNPTCLGSAWWGRLGLLAVAIAAMPAPSRAQNYDTIPVRIQGRAERALRITVSSAMRDPAAFAESRDDVEKYFKQYYFPAMTRLDPEGLRELGDLREDLFKRYIRATSNPQAQSFLTDLSLRAATVLAKGNYSPQARYNATLILGNLDQQVAGSGVNAAPPIPLPAATAVLLDLLEQEDFDGVAVHPSVKLGALVGLERHARFGISPQHAERVTNALLEAIAQEAPPADVSRDVHQWMKCRAASALVWQHRQRPHTQTMNALIGLIGNEEFDLDNRTFVAGLLERMDFTQASGLDAAAVTRALGKLSQDVLKAESKLARDFQQNMLGNRNFDFRRRGRLGFGREADNSPKYERSRLYSRLKSIYDGGSQLIDGAIPEESKQQLQDLLDAMKKARLTTADKNSIDLDVAEQVIAAAQQVDQVVQGWNASGEAAPADEPAF